MFCYLLDLNEPYFDHCLLKFLLSVGKYYPEDEEDDGPGVSAVILDHLDQMTRAMSDNVTTKTMLDVESKVRHTERSVF